MTYSYNKRQLEKKKAKKKQEKLQRKEERRKSTPSTLSEMIAYVDENGNLVDTPPEDTAPQNTEATSTDAQQKNDKDGAAMRVEGWVDSIDEEQHKGLIRTRYSMYRYAFDTASAPQGLQATDRVSFEIERSDDGKNAVNVERIKA